MIKKVNVRFGGYKTANESTIPTVWGVYNAVGDANNLLKRGFSIKFEPSGERSIPVGVFFNYALDGLDESALDDFNTQWADLAVEYGFEIVPTNITHYEE